MKMENPYKHLKVHEGETFKYRDLCNLLGIEFKRGKAKELQLKQLRQFLGLDLKTVPRKIVFKEVYDDDKQKVVSGKGKFFPFIKNILLNQLHIHTPYTGTYQDLIPMLGLASVGYAKARYANYFPTETIKKKYAHIIDTDLLAEENLYRFLSMTGPLLQEIIRSSLNQMEKKDLVSVVRSLRLFRQQTVGVGETQKKFIEKHDLSPLEHSAYVQIETDIMEEFKLSDRRQLFYRTPGKRTWIDVHELYKERLNAFIKSLGYEFSATLFIISATPEGLNYEIELPYLNKSILRNNVVGKLSRDVDLKKVIPQPTLDKYILTYFSSPILH